MFQGVRVLKPPAPYYISSLEPNQTFSVDIYVNTFTKEEFFGPSQQGMYLGYTSIDQSPKILESEPDWQIRDLTYTLDDPATNKREFNYTMDLTDDLFLEQAIE